MRKPLPNRAKWSKVLLTLQHCKRQYWAKIRKYRPQKTKIPYLINKVTYKTQANDTYSSKMETSMEEPLVTNNWYGRKVRYLKI